MNDDASAFAEEAQFAKFVSTVTGDCLLIGGRVYVVYGPDGNAADLFSRGLRNMAPAVKSNASRQMSGGSLNAGIIGGVA